MTDTTRIEALWIEPGTPFDAAAAANKYLPRAEQISHVDVGQIWKKAKAEGRLPPFVRPWNGFRPNQADILRELMRVGVKSARVKSA